MSDDEQRIAIAEWCGYSRIYFGVKGEIGDCDSEPEAYWGIKNAFWFRLPDYLNDLNATHEALSKLTSPQDRYRFSDELYKLTSVDPHGYIRKDDRFLYVNATARQRAEALLRTINKWKD